MLTQDDKGDQRESGSVGMVAKQLPDRTGLLLEPCSNLFDLSAVEVMRKLVPLFVAVEGKLYGENGIGQIQEVNAKRRACTDEQEILGCQGPA